MVVPARAVGGQDQSESARAGSAAGIDDPCQCRQLSQ